MFVSILGLQGSGKSTQAKLLEKNLKVPALNMGSLLRSLAKKEDVAAKSIKAKIEKGELISDEPILKLLAQKLKNKKYFKGVILDGVPRTLHQAEGIEKAIVFDKVVFLKVSDKTGRSRLLNRKRSDDTQKLIEKRLKLYHQKTEPQLLSLYKKQGILIEVDGEGKIEEVSKNILGQI